MALMVWNNCSVVSCIVATRQFVISIMLSAQAPIFSTMVIHIINNINKMQKMTSAQKKHLTAAQTLSPNDVTWANGSACFGEFFCLIFLQWEKVEMFCPSWFMLIVTTPSSSAPTDTYSIEITWAHLSDFTQLPLERLKAPYYFLSICSSTPQHP